MKTQEFLRNNSLQDLQDKYAIKVSRHKQYSNLVHLKYDQIKSPFEEQIVKECRALILDETDNWKVIARSYDKFWEADNPLADKINWSKSLVLEKIDGSLICLYWYKDNWYVCSSGVCDASGRVDILDITFSELFWKVWDELNYKLPDVGMRGKYCFMFELCSKYNRVVVKHLKSRIVFHGARFLGEGFRECSYDELKTISNLYGWELIQTFPIKSFEECVEASKTLDPMEAEGFVVWGDGRIKLKSDQYKEIAHFKDGMSVRKILDSIRNGRRDRFLDFFPEWKDLYDGIFNKYNNFISQVIDIFNQIKSISPRKEFAKEATKYRYSGLLFSMLDGLDVKEIVKDMNIKAIESLLDLKDKPLILEE